MTDQKAPAPQNAKPVTTSSAAPSSAPQSRQTSSLAYLQRTIGNKATLNLVQRMPTKNMVITELGKPTMNIGIGKLVLKENSTKYKAMLEALDVMDTILSQEIGTTKGDIVTQLKLLLTQFDHIFAACDEYEGETGAKAEYFNTLRIQAQNEKTMAIGPMMRASENPSKYNVVTSSRPKIRNIVGTPDPLTMNENNFVGTVGGGMNQLAHYSTGQQSGDKFFKPNTAEMDTFASQDEENSAYYQLEQNKNNMSAQEYQAQQKNLGTKANYSDFRDKGGISETDTRSSNREVASYRLDQLLDANLIARTQFALRNVNGVSTLGTSQRRASGKSAGDLKAATDTNDRTNIGADAFSTQDPAFLRMMSQLQLLDILTLQLDRHTGNFYLQLDQNGNVTGLTGIDNDMSFGTVTTVEKRIKQYSGMSQYVDKDMAVKIIGLDTALLRLAMSDLLDSAEIDALIVRLNKLKTHLQQLAMNGQLLDPTQWDVVVAQGIANEGNNYQYTLMHKANNPSRGY
jgi:hypothetical protein